LSNETLAEKLLEIAEIEDDGEPKTGRRFYYLALSHGHIQPDMGASEAAKASRQAGYNRVTTILGNLRKAGRLDWYMVLDLTRELVTWEVYTSPREARADTRDRYDEDRWIGQRYFPIFIVEKDTMEPVCQPMASDWQMPFASSRGYSSLKLQYDVAKMINDRFHRCGQRAIVYFISDHDPSGLDLQRAWEQALEDFGAQVVEVVRIGLTPDQIHEHSLQRFAIEVKPSDSRSKKYVVEHGNKCWEVDILPSSVIESDLTQHIYSWLDVERWKQRSAEIKAARELL
jgi:hypothetical protein